MTLAAPECDNETAAFGEELYQKQIRSLVETEENIGKICAVDKHTGDYEIDADLLKSAERLRARKPDADIWFERIGYDAVVAIGGTLIRTAP